MSGNQLTAFTGDVSLLSEGQVEALTELLTTLSPNSAGIEEEETTAPRIPNIKIRQAMTSDPGCPDDSEQGDLYLTGKILENPARIIPVYFYRSRVMFEGGGSSGIECYSPNAVTGSVHGDCGKKNTDSQCDHAKWSGGRPPQCQETLNAIVLLEDLSGLAHVRFSKSSFAAGKILMSLAKAGGSIWNRQQFLRSVPKTSGKNKYHAFEVSTAGVDSDPGARQIAAHFCSQFAEARKAYIESWTNSNNGDSSIVTVEPTSKKSAKVSVTVPSLDTDDPDFEDSL